MLILKNTFSHCFLSVKFTSLLYVTLSATVFLAVCKPLQNDEGEEEIGNFN